MRTSRRVTSFVANDLMALAAMDVLRCELSPRTSARIPKGWPH